MRGITKLKPLVGVSGKSWWSSGVLLLLLRKRVPRAISDEQG